MFEVPLNQPLTPQDLAIALLLTLLGFLIGLVVERWLLPHLKDGTLVIIGKRGDQVIFQALRGMIIVWSTLASAYIAILQASFGATTTEALLRLLQVPLILSLSVVSMRLGAELIDYYNTAQGQTDTSASLWRSLVSTAIFVMGLLIMLQSLGISIAPIITALGIGGLAASLALQDTLSNAFSGLYIIFSKQTKPGDYVRLKIDERDHVEGYITDISWRSTKIRMMPIRLTVDPEPSYVIVPNSRMASDIVVMHYRRQREIEMLLDIELSYGSDLDTIEQVTIAETVTVLQGILGYSPISRPLVRYRTISGAAVALTVVVYGNEQLDQHQLRHELIKRLYQRYEQAGIRLAPPAAAALPPGGERQASGQDSQAETADPDSPQTRL